MDKPHNVGIGCICGEQGPLTFEHTPPRAAFESDEVRIAHSGSLWAGNEVEARRRATKLRRGFGHYSLCERCNNTTGNWYAPSFINFVRAAFGRYDRIPVETGVSFAVETKPLNLIKQMLVMLCATSGPSLAAKHPIVRRILLNRESRDLQDSVRMLLGLTDTEVSEKDLLVRSTGIASICWGCRSGRNHHLRRDHLSASRHTWGPSWPRARASDDANRLDDAIDYDQKADIHLILPKLRPETFLPGRFKD